MTSQSSCTSIESDTSCDEFLKLLNESLVRDYHVHMMPDYVSNLMKSVNSIQYVDNGYFFHENDPIGAHDYFRKSPSMFSNDSDATQENVNNATESHMQQDNPSDNLFLVHDGDNQENTEQNIFNENSTKNFQTIGIDSKSESNNDNLSQDESSLNLSTSISTCIADDTTFGEAFKNCKSSNHQMRCMATGYRNTNVTSIVSVDTCIADNSTICDAYENWISSYRQQQSATRTVIHRNVQSSSSISTGFQGFSPVASSKRPYMEGLLRYANDIDDDDDDATTYCEISERWISTQSAIDTEKINFNLEEAYATCFLENQTENPSRDRRKTLMEEIEKLTLKILDDLKNGQMMKIIVPNKPIWSNCVFEDERLSLKPPDLNTSYVIKNKRKLSMIMFLLSFIYKLLLGVYPSEIQSLDLPWIPLTGEDVRKINDIIKRPYISKKVYEELLVLKATKRKTEVEALTIDSHDLIDAYLLKKIESGIVI